MKSFKVKLKSLKKLKKFAMNNGGDMCETLKYVIKPNGELVENMTDLNKLGSFHTVFKHVLENGEEFLVVDHPNIITKREYEMSKVLYETESEEISMKGVC